MSPVNPDSYRIKRPTIMEKIHQANVIISHGRDGLEVIKCRYCEPPKNLTLLEAIKILVNSYFRDDLVKDLTPSAMMNVPIKEDLKKAINKVLVKHGLKG